jgi:hypothetical protein
VRVQDAGGVFHTEGILNGGEGGKKGYIYSRFYHFLVQLVLFVKEHKTTHHSSCATARHLINEATQDEF